jgi:ATP-binding cassette subfamily F protein 3
MADALFPQHCLLLPNEPTNYLNLEGALWLEARLRKFQNVAIIISNDVAITPDL